MSTDYSYDDQGQFFPFFFVTLSALVVVPVTYSVLKPSTELENTAPLIKSSFRPKDAELVDGQRKKQKKRERKLKRIILATVGWAFIAFNVYWMINTQRITPKIWDPYEILGVQQVRTALFEACEVDMLTLHLGRYRETGSVEIPQIVCHTSP